jgi:hypothetical protein
LSGYFFLQISDQSEMNIRCSVAAERKLISPGKNIREHTP